MEKAIVKGGEMENKKDVEYTIIIYHACNAQPCY